mmetsp:Transcript_31330/g.62107  ORF Transcript_31330/g.62107 Transcript_31330/m.62107 type:complete len:85 (-) Transcript_31330:63-317(-)
MKISAQFFVTSGYFRQSGIGTNFEHVVQFPVVRGRIAVPLPVGLQKERVMQVIGFRTITSFSEFVVDGSVAMEDVWDVIIFEVE